jgi:D-xylose transport system permease protein
MASISTTSGGRAAATTRNIRANLQTYGLIAAVIVIWIFFSAITPNNTFISPRNFSNLFRQMTVTAILSVGMVLVIVTGNIDLSVGNLAGFVSVVVAICQGRIFPHLLGPDKPPLDPVLVTTLAVLVGLLVGLLVGILQGYIIAYLRVPAFITTLGGMWILTGAILLVTQGKTIPAGQEPFKEIAQGYLGETVSWILAAIVVAVLFISTFMSRNRKAKYGFELAPLYADLLRTVAFSVLVVGYVYMVNQYKSPDGQVLGFQNPVLLLALVALVVTYIANNTRFGRHAYAIGGNREAARLSGVNIRNRTFLIFVLMGLLCGISGIVLASYVGGGTTGAGSGYELEAIAACILGGTSTLGGEGTIIGAMVGALIMASLSNGLGILNVQTEWQSMLKGAVLVLAVYTDVQLRKNR